MPSWLMSILRTAAQALGGYAFTWLAAHGLDVPVEAQSYIVQVLLVGAGIGAWTALVRFLETRKGDGMLALAARGLARLLMLGLSGRTPVYVAPGQNLRVLGSDGTVRVPR